MSLLILIVLILVLLYAASHIALSLPIWTVIVGALLLLSKFTGFLGWVPFVLLALVVMIPLLLLNITPLRKMLISGPVRKMVKATMPPISITEQVALDAGTVWWEADLFSGNPDYEKLAAYPQASLTDEERAFVDGPTEELCKMMNDWEITQELMDLPENVWRFMKDQKFLGMIIPKKYGGLGFSANAHSTIVMKLASRSVTGAVSVMVPNSLGPAELLLHYGTEEQKDHFLPRLATGEEVPCFALTGPFAGSDAGAMRAYGVVCKGMHEGKEVLGMKVNWEKRYITLGPIATIVGLAFKAYDPDGLLGGEEDLGITCALIPRDTEGLTIGNRHFPLNSAFMNGPNFGKDVFVPMEWVIGGEPEIGNGWKMLMESLSVGRSISLPSLGVAGGKFGSWATGTYARVRHQFNLPIGRFEGVEEVMARMGGMTYMMEASRNLTMVALDSGERPSVISAIQKYNLTEMLRTVVNDGMDIHGGKGICMGPRNYIGRTYQSIPIAITVEGANIMTRSLIIFGQGAMRCHPYLLEEIDAVNTIEDKDESLKVFDGVLVKHLGHSFKNGAKSFIYALTGGRLAKVGGKLALPHYYRKLSRWSTAFAFVSDIALLVLGGQLKRREKLSGRFADILSHMYMASATLKQYENHGRQEDELPLVNWAMRYSFFQIEEAMFGILRHFPIPALGWILRGLIFPFGRREHYPGDELGKPIADILMNDCPARDRLCADIYTSEDADEPTGKLIRAHATTIAAADSGRMVRKEAGAKPYEKSNAEWMAELEQQGLLSSEQMQLLVQAEENALAAIHVDHFEHGALKK